MIDQYVVVFLYHVMYHCFMVFLTGNMVRASRNLLSSVTRLLIMADMIDVHLLMKKLRRVEDDLEYLKTVSSQVTLIINYHLFIN